MELALPAPPVPPCELLADDVLSVVPSQPAPPAPPPPPPGQFVKTFVFAGPDPPAFP